MSCLNCVTGKTMLVFKIVQNFYFWKLPCVHSWSTYVRGRTMVCKFPLEEIPYSGKFSQFSWTDLLLRKYQLQKWTKMELMTSLCDTNWYQCEWDGSQQSAARMMSSLWMVTAKNSACYYICMQNTNEPIRDAPKSCGLRDQQCWILSTSQFFARAGMQSWYFRNC